MKIKKKISYILILLIVSFLPLQAGKKPPPIPLKLLTDPNSPSYVPYPYPKTDFEIIEDFKYAVKEFYGPKEGRRVSMLPGAPDYSKIILPLLGDNPSLEIEEITKVKDLVETSSSRFLFLLKIVNQKGEVVAVGLIQDCGLLGGIQFFIGETKFRPFKKEPQVKELLLKAIGYSIHIDEMERIALHSTICSSPWTPLWKIKTPSGVFFIDHFDDVYYIEAEVPWSKEFGHPDPQHKKITVLDSLNDRVFFLRKIEK